MDEKRKYHYNVGEVKSKILEFILDSDGPVSEPIIRKHMRENFNEIGQSTINKHLNYLKKNDFIEKVSPIEKSRFNYFNITRIKQLQKIKSEFEDIKLFDHDKEILIILNNNGLRVERLNGFFIYLQLLLSESFSNACIDTSMHVLFSRIGNIYSYKNALRKRIIEEGFEKSYRDYINSYPSITISKEDFSNTFVEMTARYKEILSLEAFIKLWEEKMERFATERYDEQKASRGADGLNIYRDIYDTIGVNWLYSKKNYEYRFSLLFEGYFYQDNLLGDASQEEIDFALETKANYDEYVNSYELDENHRDSFKKWVNSDFHQASKIMFNHKKPKLFDEEIYNNRENIENALKEFFYDQILKILGTFD